MSPRKKKSEKKSATPEAVTTVAAPSSLAFSPDLSTFARTYAQSLKVGFSGDRRQRVGASEIGRCARSVAYQKCGIVPDTPDEGSGFATRGNIMEDHWTAPLIAAWVKAAGGELHYHGQENQITLQGEDVPLSSTPDGLATGLPRDFLAAYGVPDIGESGCVVFEMKSISPRYGKHKLPKGPHVPQTMTQLGLIRRGTDWQPLWGVIPYVDADDYYDIRMFPVRYDDRVFNALVRRAKLILTCDEPNKLPPEGKASGGSECGECQWSKTCLGYVPWLADDDPRAPTKKQIEDVRKVAARVHKADLKLEAAKAAKAQEEAKLYAVLNRNKRRFVGDSSFSVHAKETASQDRYSTEKLKQRIEELGGTHDDCKSATKPGSSLKVQFK